jgi:hypothetical protein
MAAVFVEPNETTVSEDLLQSHAFRRLLLQIGGANIAAARIAPSSSPTSSSLADDKACLLAPPQHGEGRDPSLKSAADRLGAQYCGHVADSWLSNVRFGSSFLEE